MVGNALHFNLSHRPGWALLAVTDVGLTGADIEPLAPLAEAAALIKELFSPPEQPALQAAALADYWPLFYLIWTRKEAYAKAQGMGLALPFAAFSVLAPGPSPRLASPADAQVLSFAAGAGWQGSVAVLGTAPIAAQHFEHPTDLLHSIVTQPE
jgi:4'-phosphopantetheinyl transferase